MPVIPCTSTPIVTGIVTFVPADFRVIYPEFTGIGDALLNQSFALAQLYLANSCGSRVFNANLREVLLTLLVAHLTWLNYGTNDGAGNVTPPQGIVGRVNTATEGSVTVGAEMIATANSDWYLQTRYGAQYWAATARFRTALAIAPIIVVDGPWGEGWGGGIWGGGCGGR